MYSHITVSQSQSVTSLQACLECAVSGTCEQRAEAGAGAVQEAAAGHPEVSFNSRALALHCTRPLSTDCAWLFAWP